MSAKYDLGFLRGGAEQLVKRIPPDVALELAALLEKVKKGAIVDLLEQRGTGGL